MRHAKSDWSDGSLDDFDRPLNERGNKSAHLMGKQLKKLGIIPDLIISSPAKRAKKTAILFAENNSYQNEIDYNSDFYYGDENDIIEAVRQVDANIEKLMIVAHNPTMEILATNLNENNDYVQFKTATIAVFTVDTDNWADLQLMSCKLKMHLNPSDIKD